MKNSDCHFKDVIDSLSNTIVFGEQQHALVFERGFGWWFSGDPAHSMFTAMVPINKSHEYADIATTTVPDWFRVFVDASSFHAHGANFCFLDGSVRFLSENIDSADPTNTEMGCMWDELGWSDDCSVKPRVYQALTTRNGEEVVGGF